MSEEKFDFGSMVSAQMKTFRPGFKFPGSFNDLKSVESDPNKRRAAVEAAADVAEESAVEEKNPLDKSIKAAFEAGDPVEGTVEKEVKGGYEVTVKGQRAFCPFSQIPNTRKNINILPNMIHFLFIRLSFHSISLHSHPLYLL